MGDLPISADRIKSHVNSPVLQFRAVSFGLYGTQEYHRSVRQKAVEYMRQHQEDYQAFLGESVDEYLSSMQQAGTWGDELTLVRFSQQPCM